MRKVYINKYNATKRERKEEKKQELRLMFGVTFREGSLLLFAFRVPYLT